MHHTLPDKNYKKVKKGNWRQAEDIVIESSFNLKFVSILLGRRKDWLSTKIVAIQKPMVVLEEVPILLVPPGYTSLA